MEVILMQRVANLGELGEVVKVRPGFARNYLIPQGKAKRVTPDNLAEFEAKRAELERLQAEELSKAQDQSAKLDGLTIQVTRKAGVDGRLFGSVTNFDIAEALEAQGIEVSKATIRMPEGPIKQIGDTRIAIGLHSDVTATIIVSVLGE